MTLFEKFQKYIFALPFTCEVFIWITIKEIYKCNDQTFEKNLTFFIVAVVFSLLYGLINILFSRKKDFNIRYFELFLEMGMFSSLSLYIYHPVSEFHLIFLLFIILRCFYEYLIPKKIEEIVCMNIVIILLIFI